MTTRVSVGAAPGATLLQIHSSREARVVGYTAYAISRTVHANDRLHLLNHSSAKCVLRLPASRLGFRTTASIMGVE